MSIATIDFIVVIITSAALIRFLVVGWKVETPLKRELAMISSFGYFIAIGLNNFGLTYASIILFVGTCIVAGFGVLKRSQYA